MANYPATSEQSFDFGVGQYEPASPCPYPATIEQSQDFGFSQQVVGPYVIFNQGLGPSPIGTSNCFPTSSTVVFNFINDTPADTGVNLGIDASTVAVDFKFLNSGVIQTAITGGVFQSPYSGTLIGGVGPSSGSISLQVSITNINGFLGSEIIEVFPQVADAVSGTYTSPLETWRFCTVPAAIVIPPAPPFACPDIPTRVSEKFRDNYIISAPSSSLYEFVTTEGCKQFQGPYTLSIRGTRTLRSCFPYTSTTSTTSTGGINLPINKPDNCIATRQASGSI